MERAVSKFYFLVWMKWALRLTFNSIGSALFLALLIGLFMYVQNGMPTVTSAVQKALFDITRFWFMILWSLMLLLFLFRAFKGIFNDTLSGYKLELLTCPKEGKTTVIDVVGYGDLVKVWRKWFMLIIWLVGTQMIFALIIASLLSLYEHIFDWFNIYVLYGFILVAGYFSFMILPARCKRVELVKC